jgi:hypothetical protein
MNSRQALDQSCNHRPGDMAAQLCASAMAMMRRWNASKWASRWIDPLVVALRRRRCIPIARRVVAMSPYHPRTSLCRPAIGTPPPGGDIRPQRNRRWPWTCLPSGGVPPKQNLGPDAVLPAAVPSLALRSSISSANCLNASVLRAPLASWSIAGTARLGRLRSVRVVGQFPCPSIESPTTPPIERVPRSIGRDRIPRFRDLQRAGEMRRKTEPPFSASSR